MGDLKVYEISESELDKLENGHPGQIHLSFALALLPAALTILVTLQTVPIADNRIYYGYLTAFLVFVVEGFKSLVQWLMKSRSYKKLVEGIRARMPTKPGIPEDMVVLTPSPPAESSPDSMTSRL